MNQKRFSFLAGMIFTLIALLHLARIIYGWNATIGGWNVPLWPSWAALVVAGCLGYQGFKLSKR